MRIIRAILPTSTTNAHARPTPARSLRRSLASEPLYHLRTAMAAPVSAHARPAPPPDRRPVVVSGPSGVGKGTLYQRLFQRHPDTFCLSVSHTTRAPRQGERDGEHYFFVSMADFENLIAQDGFLEHAQFGGNRYGTSKMTIEEQTRKGKVTLLDIEMEGVKQIQRASIPARFVFIAPPSLDVLESRLRGRGTEKEESIQKRLAQARHELEYAKTPGVHERIIVNDDLDKAYDEFEAFVFQPAEP